MTSGAVPPRRRARAETVRRCELRLRLSPAELAAVTGAAGADGLAVGAWVGQIAVRVARGEAEPLPMTWRDLLGELVRFRAEVTGLHAATDRDGPARDSGGRASGVPGHAAQVLLRRIDDAIATALAAGRSMPPVCGATRRDG